MNSRKQATFWAAHTIRTDFQSIRILLIDPEDKNSVDPDQKPSDLDLHCFPTWV